MPGAISAEYSPQDEQRKQRYAGFRGAAQGNARLLRPTDGPRQMHGAGVCGGSMVSLID